MKQPEIQNQKQDNDNSKNSEQKRFSFAIAKQWDKKYVQKRLQRGSGFLFIKGEQGQIHVPSVFPNFQNYK